MNLIVTCSHCKQQLEHVCNEKLGKAVEDLFKWAPGHMRESVIREAKKEGYFEKGDDEAPFFSEAYLYNLLGKEDARTVLALIHGVIRSAGLDPYTIEAKTDG